jgi:hypothetical protein
MRLSAEGRVIAESATGVLAKEGIWTGKAERTERQLADRRLTERIWTSKSSLTTKRRLASESREAAESRLSTKPEAAPTVDLAATEPTKGWEFF